MRTILRICTLAATLCILAGCTMQNYEILPYDTVDVSYECDNGLPLRVTYDRTNDTADVNDMMTISRDHSEADVLRYTTPQHELLLQNSRASIITWTVGLLTPVTCKALNGQPSASLG